MTRALRIELEDEAFDELLANAKRRNLTIGELAEKVIGEALTCDLLPAILGEDEGEGVVQ